jgi:hypothetical protein
MCNRIGLQFDRKQQEAADLPLTAKRSSSLIAGCDKRIILDIEGDKSQIDGALQSTSEHCSGNFNTWLIVVFHSSFCFKMQDSPSFPSLPPNTSK